MTNEKNSRITVGITQRVDVSNTGERRDCLDQQWQRFFSQLDMGMLPLPNLSLPDSDDPEAFTRWRSVFPIQALLLSGGATPAGENIPDDVTTPERDVFERFLIDGCVKTGLPVLGVCRGLQMLACYFGAVLTPVGGHVSVRHPLTSECSCVPPLPDEVNSYHCYTLMPHQISDCLEVIATATDGSVEAFRHRTLPIFAVMWHPERETQFRRSEMELVSHFFRMGKSQ